MYARIVQVSLLPEVITDAAHYFRESTGPALKLQPGFKSSSFFVNQTTNQCMIVTLWETDEARTELEANSFLQNLLPELKPYFAGHPGIDYYEMVVQVP
jgi:hypothetical protein